MYVCVYVCMCVCVYVCTRIIFVYIKHKILKVVNYVNYEYLSNHPKATKKKAFFSKKACSLKAYNINCNVAETRITAIQRVINTFEH